MALLGNYVKSTRSPVSGEDGFAHGRMDTWAASASGCSPAVHLVIHSFGLLRARTCALGWRHEKAEVHNLEKELVTVSSQEVRSLGFCLYGLLLPIGPRFVLNDLIRWNEQGAFHKLNFATITAKRTCLPWKAASVSQNTATRWQWRAHLSHENNCRKDSYKACSFHLLLSWLSLSDSLSNSNKFYSFISHRHTHSGKRRETSFIQIT